jgi:acetyltransferase-like isoleucine patch superfamily enzyme
MTKSRIRYGVGVTIAGSVTIAGKGLLILDDYVVIEPNVVIDLGTSSEGCIKIRSRAKIKTGTVLRCYAGGIDIGHRVTLGEYGIWLGHGGISVGSHCIVASHCAVTAAQHLHTSDVPIRHQGEKMRGVRIGSGVWMGSGVRILDGVSVGDGTIIGAGAVVTRTMPANTICHGVPCRAVKQRWT